MEVLLHWMQNLVALGLAGIAILAAFMIGTGKIRSLQNAFARVILTAFFSVVGLWILSIGIRHLSS